jgi:hypothetical protein
MWRRLTCLFSLRIATVLAESSFVTTDVTIASVIVVWFCTALKMKHGLAV